MSANTIGFEFRPQRDLHKAVKALNDLPARRLTISSLATCVVLRDSEAATTARASIERFPSDLPFDFEEERANSEMVSFLEQQAIPRVAVASRENYQVRRTAEKDRIEITFKDPRVSDSAKQKWAQEAVQFVSITSMAVWASEVLEKKLLLSREEYGLRLTSVRSSCASNPVGATERDEIDWLSRARVGVAAACLALGTELTIDEISWCKERILEVAVTQPDPSHWSQPYVQPTLEPAVFAAHGLASFARRGEIEEQELQLLLRICCHPLDYVSKNAISAVADLHVEHPRLAWAAMLIGVKRSVVPVRRFDPEKPEGNPNAQQNRMNDVFSNVFEWYRGGEEDFDGYSLPTALEPIVDDDRPWRIGARQSGELLMDHRFLGEVLKGLPWETMVSDRVIGAPTLRLLESLILWTVNSVRPVDGKQSRRGSDDQRVANLMIWAHDLFGCLARTALVIPTAEARHRFLDLALSLPDNACLALLSNFVGSISVRGVMDPEEASEPALSHLLVCAERVSRVEGLGTRDFGTHGIRSRDLKSVIQNLFFVSIDNASQATRFANGDFSDLHLILPIIETIAGAAAKSNIGLEAYLNLCERSISLFPTAPFVHVVNDILGKSATAPLEWIGTSVPGRIAALIHDLAERDRPLDPALSRAMLVILDALVDIGDRRSAALQANQIFSEVRLA